LTLEKRALSLQSTVVTSADTIYVMKHKRWNKNTTENERKQQNST